MIKREDACVAYRVQSVDHHKIVDRDVRLHPPADACRSITADETDHAGLYWYMQFKAVQMYFSSIAWPCTVF